jgi:hypothetical protein
MRFRTAVILMEKQASIYAKTGIKFFQEAFEL